MRLTEPRLELAELLPKRKEKAVVLLRERHAALTEHLLRHLLEVDGEPLFLLVEVLQPLGQFLPLLRERFAEPCHLGMELRVG